jgi:transposase-like protein
MAPRANHKRLDSEGQGLIQELLQVRLKPSIQYTFITVLEEEVEAFLNAALYQRTPNRQGHRNGHYERDLLNSLEADFESWKQRKPKAHFLYVFADGTYFTVIYDQEGGKMPILAVIGIDEDGQRDVLGFSVGEQENQFAWEDLLENLKSRGVEAVVLWITDGNRAMLNAIENKFPSSQRQRCIKHKMENVLGYIPEKHHELVRPELKAIFRYIRTTNIIERLFGEVKKRSHKKAAAFRNENSCLLMFYAVIRSVRLRRITVTTKDPELLHNS